ncbi:MAG: tetracycline resistance efflux pump [Burkholderiales bacterium]|jgi:DHA1 family tetracycline resistance protein-like MFS transporter|nr:tetracycline resistance efflux pump [Burkholderiales bacterium]
MNQNRALFSIFLTIFIALLGVGVLIPIYPLLVVSHSPFRVIPDSWSSGSGLLMLGWLSASFPMAQFISSPIWGQLSDKFGRKRTMLLSVFGTSISYLLFAIAIIYKNIPLLFFSRIMDGCAGGNIAIAQAAIADISTPQNRAKNFGLIGMAFGLGFIIGPVIGGVFSNHNLVSWFNAATPFYFIAGLCFFNMFFIIKFLPETLKIRSEKRINITKPLHNIAMAFSKPGLRNIMPAIFLFNGGFTFFSTFCAVIMASKYHFTQTAIGNYFAYVGVMIVLSQGILVRRIAKVAKDYQVLRFSLFGTGICLMAYFFIPTGSYYLLYVIPPFLAGCNALTMSFNGALITRVTPENMRGEAMGINSSVMAMSWAIPAIISGYIASIGETLPILVGSIVCISGGVCFWLMFNPKQFPNV